MEYPLGNRASMADTVPANGRRLVAALLALAAVSVFGGRLAAQQAGSIGGSVVMAATGQPVAGAQVSIVGTSQGTLTGDDGRFLIPGVQGTNVAVRVTMIGYQTAEQQTAVPNLDLRFQLVQKAVELNQLVVTGTPGAEQKKAIGNVVSTVDVAQVTQTAPVTTVEQVLNGRAPGVTVLSSTGEVGGAAKIRIRGPATFSLSNTPLIYVDGVRVDNEEATGPTAAQSFGSALISRLGDLDPNNIQSIEIIKGPAAATLYGTEAAAGVIQIITKKGQPGKVQFDMSIQQGSNWFGNPAGRLWTNYAMVNGQLDSLNFNQLQANWRADQKSMGLTPQNIFQNGYLQQYDLSASGGTDLVHFYMSGGYEHDTGVEPTNKVRKGNGRLNVTVTPSSKWRLNGNFGYVLGRTDLACESGCGGVTWTTYFMSPAKVNTPRVGFWSGTPQSYHALYPIWQDVGRFTGSVQINNNPAPWFSHRITFGVDQTREGNHDLELHNDAFTYFDSFAAYGYANVEQRQVNYTTVDYSATAKLDVSHSLQSNTSAGAQYYRKHIDYTSAYGENFPVPGLTSVDATTQNRTSSQSYLNNTTVGVYGQEQLVWAGRRFFTVALRADDNSAFGANFKAAYYPKASATWVLSDEPFFKLPVINTLRLRAAYGQSGQQPAEYASLRTYNPVTGPNDVGTVTPATVGNPNLGPERSGELEVGFDAGAFNDRLGLEFTYYNEHTRDAILLRDIAPSTGFSGTQWINAGRIDNSGIEVLLRGTPYTSKNLIWDFSFNVSTNHNEVKSLGSVTTLPYVSAGTYIEHHIGYPVGSWFQKKVVSAQLDANGNAINVMCDGGPGQQPVPCANAPNVYLGRNTPAVDGGVNTTLTLFGALRLYGQVDFKTGFSKLDGNLRVRCFFFDLCRENYVPQDYNPVRIASIQNGYPDVLIKDASFAKLREISATYSLPDTWAGRFGAHSASITVAGRNLATWTKYTGLEPEATFNGGSRGGDYSLWEQDVLPQLAQFVATLRVSF